MFQLSDSTRSPSEEKLDQVYFTVFYLENVEFDLKSGWKDLQVLTWRSFQPLMNVTVETPADGLLQSEFLVNI